MVRAPEVPPVFPLPGETGLKGGPGHRHQALTVDAGIAFVAEKRRLWPVMGATNFAGCIVLLHCTLHGPLGILHRRQGHRE